MATRIGAPVIRDMLNHATRAEAPVIETAALARGYLWRCGNRTTAYGNTITGCGRINGDDESYCPSCGKARKA